jgi:hypothetical protein
MSLETALQANTEALTELTAAIRKLSPVVQPAQAAAETEAKKSTKSSGTTKESEVSSAPSDTGAAKIDFAKDIGEPFLALYGRDPATAAALVESFGVKKLSQVPQERWAEVIGAIKDASK